MNWPIKRVLSLAALPYPGSLPSVSHQGSRHCGPVVAPAREIVLRVALRWTFMRQPGRAV
jgi:hypothetical protein